ncbi:hypothetical protein JZ785_17600 [Alicyclobacillus curvatus]|nr:hypothetical protein JZ785_17600 [Alicyclobacillus curvatus]
MRWLMSNLREIRVIEDRRGKATSPKFARVRRVQIGAASKQERHCHGDLVEKPSQSRGALSFTKDSVRGF